MNQTEALDMAYQIIDAQARQIKALERGHWRDRTDRQYIEDTMPILREYRRLGEHTHDDTANWHAGCDRCAYLTPREPIEEGTLFKTLRNLHPSDAQLKDIAAVEAQQAGQERL